MRLFKKIMARAQNDAGERIESLRFSVPALRVGVLEYGAGQLQTNNTALDGKTVKLYYPPEAVSDKDFLKSLETAPVIVGGHDSTTNEQNKRIDGWAHNVTYDAVKKAAMLDGVVKGAKEVAYIRGNLGSEGFGASAFVDIYNLKVENGVTPDGQEYNAIAGELRATHVALAPHVRDPENKIRATNAVCSNTDGVTMTEDMTEAKNAIEKIRKVTMELDEKQLTALVVNTVREAMSAKNAEDEMEALRTKNAELEEELKALKGKAENEASEGKETPEEEKEEEEAKEGATLENACKPSQAVVAAFAAAYNTDFGAKTPSFGDLAGLAGIKESAGSARIAAVNAKYEEIKKAAPAGSASASNTVMEVF